MRKIYTVWFKDIGYKTGFKAHTFFQDSEKKWFSFSWLSTNYLEFITEYGEYEGENLGHSVMRRKKGSSPLRGLNLLNEI